MKRLTVIVEIIEDRIVYTDGRHIGSGDWERGAKVETETISRGEDCFML
jgi:hypothetical protein